MNVGLLIPVYNRPEYLQRCLDSLQGVDFPPGCTILCVDDCSTDDAVINLLSNFKVNNCTERVNIYRTKNSGIKDVLSIGYKMLFGHYGCDIVVNLDSDAIVKPNFITRLLELKKQFPDHIISGFNSRNEDNGKLRNPIISEHEGYALKQYVNGINMVIDRNQYEEIKPVLEQTGNWDFNISKANKLPKVIAVPSLVQHIGLVSSMGHNNNPDVACDFKLLTLPDVTLFGIDAHDPKGITRAANICTENVEFGAVKIITERLFQGREGYSQFCIKDMVAYIETSHVLIIHADGFIQNPLAWDNDWLQYDYIGATWWYKDAMNVGNGGFSLRSKKLLDILASLELTNYHPEDDIICRQLRPVLEQEHGIKFATEDVANKFSIEAFNTPANTYTGQFGFHGYNVKGLPISPAPRGTARPIPQARNNIRPTLTRRAR